MSGSHFKMDRLAIKSVVVFVLTVTESLLGDTNRIGCDSVYFGELDQLSLIECQVHHPKIDVYWFKGPDTTVYPIISSEGGKVEWGRGYEDKYNLTDNQMLQIFDTEPEDEGAYTVRIYFTNFDFETETTELRVYSRPADPCLRIDSCDSTCDDCRLNVSSSGELKCHVNGSRPRVNLQWVVANQSGISFIHHEQVERYDEVSGTFNTTRTAVYTADSCGGTASLHCSVSVSDHLFESLVDVHNRNVQIFPESCKYIIPNTTKPPSKEGKSVVWPVAISVIVLLVIVVLVVVCYIRRKKGSGLSHGKIESEKYTELKPSGSDVKRPSPRQPPKPKDVKKELIKALIKHYEQFCFIKPLPWGEPIPIDALYTECECTVTTEKGTSDHTSKYLSTADFNFDCKRVFITADLGYGKTTFTQHLVKRWISHEVTVKGKEKIKTDHPVLIYFHLKEVTRSMVLSKFVQRMLPAGSNLTCSDIEGIFRSNECHILLDGLDELSMSSQAEATSEISENDTAELTIGSLLDDKINMNIYKHLRVWVTSREVDDMKSEFSLPYSKVKMLGFSRQQIVEYIHKTCEYYSEQKHIPEMALFVDYADDDISSDNSATYKADHQLSKTTDGIEKPSSGKQKISEDICAKQSDSDVVNVSETKENKNQMHVVNENTEEIREPTVHTKLLEDAQQDSNKRPPDDESNGNKRKEDEMSTEKESKATATGTMDTGKRKALKSLKELQDDIINFIEVHEIISIFSETPLLQIMIIHILTCRILDPTGRYKEMNISKLTTIIRLVITCLESRYVQKVHKDSIKVDIKTLESKLGETAFKNKLKVTLGQKEFWESELGKEGDVKTALEIGLLKYSKGVTSGGIQLAELAFSSHSGIEFYHEFFKEYLAAQYISENKTKWKWLDEFIKGSGDEATVRLLQFMFGMNNPKLERAYKTLVDEKKMWNNLIDCIYEVGDPGKKRSMLVDLKNQAKKPAFNMNLNIKYLERKHHSVAVCDFCKECNDHQISISRMTFREACAIDFVKKVTLPTLDILIFLEMDIDETQFVSILTSLSVKKCPKILLFVACEVPQTLNGEDLTNVALAMKENEKMKIYKLKTISQANVTVPAFNCQKGTWGTAFFPKHF